MVYNPKSSKSKDVERVVLGPLRKKYADLVEYQILPTNFDDNVAKIARLLREDDVVISAGGDGTAAIASNAILASKKPQIVIGYLGFGNFNDLARSFTGKKTSALQLSRATKTVKLYPLDIIADQQHFRFAILYATLGLLAKSTLEFEKPHVRHHVKNSKINLIYSLLILIKFYFQKRRFFKNQSDIIVMNGRRAGGILRTKCDYYASETFKITTQNLSKLPRLILFVTKSFFGQMSGKTTTSKIFEFKRGANLDFQSEGEYFALKNIKELKIQKSTQFLNVITV